MIDSYYHIIRAVLSMKDIRSDTLIDFAYYKRILWASIRCYSHYRSNAIVPLLRGMYQDRLVFNTSNMCGLILIDMDDCCV